MAVCTPSTFTAAIRESVLALGIRHQIQSRAFLRPAVRGREVKLFIFTSFYLFSPTTQATKQVH